MKLSPRSIFLASIAVLCGLIVLAGYFSKWPPLYNARQMILLWASILFAAAMLVGVLNLGRAHLRKITGRKPGWPYSLALLVALLAALAAGLVFSPTGEPARWIFNYIQLPIESSLAAILAVTLVYTAARLLGRRLNLYSIAFLAALLFVLLASVTLLQEKIPYLDEAYAWVTQVWAVGGGRGLLLGIALGIIAAGLRAIFGADRPYEP